MNDVVARVSRANWPAWLAEGDLAGAPWSGREHALVVAGWPSIDPGERVYVVVRGLVRGWAPLIRAERMLVQDVRRTALIRGGGACASTPMCLFPDTCICPVAWNGPHPLHVRARRSFMYRHWRRIDEWLFPSWATEHGYTE